MKDLSSTDLPREKMEKYGTGKLADHELLAIILGSGTKGMNVLQLSKRILSSIQKNQSTVTLDTLRSIKGLGNAKASQVLAVYELARRLENAEQQEILSAKEVWRLLAPIRESKREHMVAFYLDVQLRLLEQQIIAIGTANVASIHPRDVFEPAVRLSAVSVLIAHNHPAGTLTPSAEDKAITARLAEAGRLLGIPLADHVIVAKNGQFSFKEQGML